MCAPAANQREAARHSRILRVEAIEWMVDYLGMDPNMADYECRATNGAHIRHCTLYGQKCNLHRHDVSLVLYQSDYSGPVELGAAIMGWIISYFRGIHDFAIDPAYDEGMPRTARYVLQRGKNAVGPYRVYQDRTVHDDIRWTPFTDYRHVVPFDRIALYFGWLACGTNTMVRYMPKRCMRQFARVHMISRSPFEAAPDTVTQVGLTAIFEDWAHHLVPEEYRRMVASQEWHCVEGKRRGISLC
ncbi:uncharacterized protein LOC131646457 [Vicia villosa]|uniref:uncharacterized protein LOC131646457 n=1 Tax=Vicia villosa TaxID=3911 RepID=UPI00273B784A|nr:uncharacterized protein LOC131646457 [Vicia villosa]